MSKTLLDIVGNWESERVIKPEHVDYLIDRAERYDETSQDANILHKQNKRYPDGFSEEDSKNRVIEEIECELCMVDKATTKVDYREATYDVCEQCRILADTKKWTLGVDCHDRSIQRTD